MNHKDFAVSLVAIAPIPAVSGTTIGLTTGRAARFPIPPCYVNASPPNEMSTLDNTEKLLVTDIDLDNDIITVVRAQGETTAKNIEVNWVISNAIYADDVDSKVDKVDGKGLSTEDYTTAEKSKLAGVEEGADVNNISDPDATDLTDGGATTLHKHSFNNLDDIPTIPDELSDLADDSTHRLVTDTEKSYWNAKQEALIADTDYLTPSTASSTYEPIIVPPVDNPETKYLNGNKQWVAVSVGGGGVASNLYYTTINSDISGYKKISYTPEATETILETTVTNQEILARTYLFDDPIEVSIIDSGVWISNYTARVSNATGVTQFKIEPFVRHSNGTETVLFSSYSREINNTAFETTRDESVQPSHIVDPTDRLGVRIYVKTTSGAAITVYSIAGDGNASYISTPLSLRHAQTRDKNGEAEFQHMTAAEKTNLNNQSGVNSGDDAPNSLYSGLEASKLNIDQTTPQTTVGTFIFPQLSSPIIRPLADSTSAFGFFKANGTTNVLNVDTTNSWIGIGTTSPTVRLDVNGMGKFSSSAYPVLEVTRTSSLSVAALVTSRFGLKTTADMADGTGCYMGFSIEDDTSGPQLIGLVGAFRDGADNTGAVSIQTYNAGVQGEVARFTASKRIGLRTALPTHTITLGSLADGYCHYNTVDQETNYERARAYWSSSAYYIGTSAGGSGVIRDLYIGDTADYYKYSKLLSSSYVHDFKSVLSGTTSTGSIRSTTVDTHSAGVAIGQQIYMGLTQTSTAGYYGLLINIAQNSVGSGAKNLIVGTVDASDKFKVESTGNVKLVATNDVGYFLFNAVNYGMAMGNTSNYKYGGVQDYSIKFLMDGGSTRGWTWGGAGAVPVAALTIGGNFQIAGTLTLVDKDIVLSATTGTKIGTAATQKLSFYGATPIVQPSSTSAAATDLATVITLANNLRSKLISLGLIA